ncbi:MAG: glycosyltransferase [Candidatus Paceibacterota bacterium]|jgi:glycosyltransferase involved in cell wall biosynthesis
MTSNLKKALIISSYAPPAIGGPQNLFNLLRDFPENSYCILTSFYNIDNLSAKTDTWLKGKYIFYDNITASGSFKTHSETTKELPSRSILNKLKHLVKRIRFLGILGGIFIIGSQIIMMLRAGIKSIKKEKIEIMLGISDYGPAMISTYLLHKITKKPYYIFLFDIYKGNFYSVFPAILLAKIFEPKLFKNAKKIIVTNEGAKEFYTKRYGDKISDKFVVIHNSVFPEPYLKFQKSQPIHKPKPPYTILFTGKIYWPQIGALKNLIKAVNEINDKNIKLKIYTPSPTDYLKEIGIEESSKVEISVAPPSEMPKIQNQADILFLPLSWHTKSQAIIDTATPGKLTDYLIAGRPILIHAPTSTYLVQYAKKNNFAMVVDEENIEKFKIAVKKLLTDKKLVEELIKNAQKTFFENHDANRNTLILQLLFS